MGLGGGLGDGLQRGIDHMGEWGEEVPMPPEMHRLGGGLNQDDPDPVDDLDPVDPGEQPRDGRGRWTREPSRSGRGGVAGKAGTTGAGMLGALIGNAAGGAAKGAAAATRGGGRGSGKERPRLQWRKPRKRAKVVTRTIDFGLFKVTRTVRRERGPA